MSPFSTLPKVLLHDHLDGSLRVSTLLDLCREQGITPPRGNAVELAAWFEANAMAGSLERYLEGFALTVAAMASTRALTRVAREAAEDAHREGCIAAEFRMAPLLLEPHGVSGEAAVEAMLEGLAQGPLPTGLIICGMRHHEPAQVLRAAELALRYRAGTGRHGHPCGVIGFDLAGPERGFPPSLHRAALELVGQAGLPITLHAGEADEASRVLEAARLGARRIGHGVRLADLIGQPQGIDALAELNSRGVHLEVCPTSNVQTGAADSIAEHPIRALWAAGQSLSFHTDNHLISCTTMVREAQLLVEQAGMTLADLARMQALAIEASFLPDTVKATARAALAQWTQQHLSPNA